MGGGMPGDTFLQFFAYFLILEHAAQSQLHQSYFCPISGSWPEIHENLCQRLEWNGDKTRSSVSQLHCHWR